MDNRLSPQAWFDFECYAMLKSKKRLIRKLNKQRRTGESKEADAIWEQVRKLSQAQTKLHRDKKLNYINEREAEGDHEAICSVVLGDLVIKV